MRFRTDDSGLKRCFAALAILLCCSGCGSAATPQQTDLDYALRLFEANQLDVAAGSVERVLRDEIETVIWVSAQYADLPVFYHQTGYSFDSDGNLSLQPGTNDARLLGIPLPLPSAFPIDHRPDITEVQVFDTFRDRVGREPAFPKLLKPDTTLHATLGFYNLNQRTSRPAMIRLVWRVMPTGSEIPVAMIGAKKGDLLFFDSGIRTITPEPAPPSPAGADQSSSDDPAAEFIGRWFGIRCASRGYRRDIEMRVDRTFSATDLVSPCPADVECIWDGIVSRSGNWRLRGGGLIELLGSYHSNQAKPLPGGLRYNRTEDLLVEAVPGESNPCEYGRAG